MTHHQPANDIIYLAPGMDYRDTRHAVRYMARLNAQAPWQPGRVHVVASTQSRSTYGGKRVKRRIRDEHYTYYESIVAASEALNISKASISKSLNSGQLTSFGQFYDVNEDEYQRWVAEGNVQSTLAESAA